MAIRQNVPPDFTVYQKCHCLRSRENGHRRDTPANEQAGIGASDNRRASQQFFMPRPRGFSYLRDLKGLLSDGVGGGQQLQ